MMAYQNHNCTVSHACIQILKIHKKILLMSYQAVFLSIKLVKLETSYRLWLDAEGTLRLKFHSSANRNFVCHKIMHKQLHKYYNAVLSY